MPNSDSDKVDNRGNGGGGKGGRMGTTTTLEQRMKENEDAMSESSLHHD